jgi:hypothetical protein
MFKYNLKNQEQQQFEGEGVLHNWMTPLKTSDMDLRHKVATRKLNDKQMLSGKE